MMPLSPRVFRSPDNSLRYMSHNIVDNGRRVQLSVLRKWGRLTRGFDTRERERKSFRLIEDKPYRKNATYIAI